MNIMCAKFHSIWIVGLRVVHLRKLAENDPYKGICRTHGPLAGYLKVVLVILLDYR